MAKQRAVEPGRARSLDLAKRVEAVENKSPRWQAAYDTMLRLMDEGLPLGGVRVRREEIYERGPAADS